LRRLAERLRGEPFGLPAVSREIEACLQEGNRILRWAGRVLDFRQRTLVMGILNCTPDSFYPGSRAASLQDAVDRAREMIAAGADILDVGGESSRPGAGVVDAARELERILPVIQAIRRESDILVSVDTRKSEVAGPALEAGADLINDISALRHDPRMVGLAAERGVPVVLMHMRGTPETMQQLARYEDTVSEVIRELRSAIDSTLEGGISPERIIVDPGIGFGKTTEDNLRILKHLSSFTTLGYPLLVGLSRKSFLGHITGRPVEERLAGTIAADALAVLGGADILRVHDVREAVETVRVIDAVRQAAG
jgi:dihydropteroate synthase